MPAVIGAQPVVVMFDGEPVDDDAVAEQHAAHALGQRAGIAAPVARQVDHPPVGRERHAAQLPGARQQGVADRGRPRQGRRTDRFQAPGQRERGGDAVDPHPRHRAHLLVRPRPEQHGDRDAPQFAPGNGLVHVAMPEGGGQALALQRELGAIDADRNVERQHEGEVDGRPGGGARPAGRRGQRENRQQDGRQARARGASRPPRAGHRLRSPEPVRPRPGGPARPRAGRAPGPRRAAG